MKSSIKTPILNIVKETVKKVKKDKLSKIGIIGTKATIKLGLYEEELRLLGIDTINPTLKEQETLTKIIVNILKGDKNKEDIKKIKKIFQRFKKEKAEGIILGCTEFPLLIKQKDTNIKLFDTIKILAKSVVECNVSQPSKRIKTPSTSRRIR